MATVNDSLKSGIYPHVSLVSLAQADIYDNIVSDSLRIIFQWIFYSVLCQLIDIFRIITNIINIICFVKQGFKDPINISLLGLAISDLGSLVPLVWTNICYNPAFNDLDLSFEPIELQYLTGAWPHGIFSRVTSWITALITLERCLCITLPLKVKIIMTPSRVIIIIVTIFILLLVSICPLYYVNRYAFRYSPSRNKTVLGLVFTEDRDEVERVLFAVNNILLPGTAFAIVIVCTAILAVSLRFKTQWRTKSMTTTGSTQVTSNRDQRVTKMVSVISSLFIVCYFPLCLIIAALLIEPELSIDGRYRNTLIAVCGVSFFLESANSASNIFIYYHMSSRFQAVFKQVMLK